MMRARGVAVSARNVRPDSVEETTPPAEEEANRYRIEEGDGTSHAQRIVKELYHRYQKQLQRWRDYRNLFFFLGFVALFLAVLYTQRQANTAFKVHSTMKDVLVPDVDNMASTDDVYAWLTGVLTAVWVDPKCGDGICEAPFEFASYSRFGCRADCGKLQDVQNLTTVQVDIYWDFSHPVGSIPASDLMQQTTWNICPISTPFANGCYYDKDNSFDRLSSTDTNIISDMPDGNWTLTMRRDIFYKTRGAVRNYAQLNAVSYYYRVYIAALSALAEQNMEMQLLTQAAANGNSTLMNFISNNIQTTSGVNATTAAFYMDQFLVATCGCGSEQFNSSVTWLNSGMLLNAFNNTVGGITDVPTYLSSVCVPRFGANANILALAQNYLPANVTSSGTLVFGSVPAGTNYTTVNVTQAATNLTAYCNKMLGNLTWWREVQTNTTQALMIDRRLGDSKTTGKIATRNSLYGTLRNYVLLSAPELFDPIFTYPKGSQAISDMPNARLDILQEQFVAGIYYFSQPKPADLNITRRTIYAANVTLISMAQRALARLNESRFQQIETLNIPVLPNPTYAALQYPAMSVSQLITAFSYALGNLTATGATCQLQGCTPVLMADDVTTLVLPNATLPDANHTALNITAWGGQGIQTGYNLVSWAGNSTAYMTCNLPARGPEYTGTCVNMTTSCTVTNNDTQPYACTDLLLNTPITGNLSSVNYRQTCETPCDYQLDCNALCDCSSTTCGSAQVCECKACQDLSRVASGDSAFVDITASATSAGRDTAVLADLSSSSSTTGRRLAQTTTDTLSAVLTQVGTVKTQQDSISTQMTSLQAQVQRANTLAEARANDNRLIDLISAGRQDIAAGQARVEAKLDEIIGKQNQSLAAAAAATQALTAIQGLAQKQLAAQQALEKAVQNQLSAIKTATYSGVITLTQALALWKRARRDRALTLKAAKLANVPCTSLPSKENVFLLSNGNAVDDATARERNIGLTNRVLQGLLLHQFRTNETNCTDSKFNKIQQTCTGPTTLKSFGVDPVFKLGTTLYDPDLDDVQGTKVLDYYNCSLLSNPTYNISFQNGTSNPAPYCAELYNSQKLPYSFHHFPLDGKEPGFPVFFDINLDSTAAASWETYLQEGLYLDQHTRSLTAELVTYNAPLRIFGYFYIEFFFSDGGSIKLTHRLHTVRVELYNSYDDSVRFAFEIILSIWIYGMMLFTLWQILMTQKEQKNFLKFFAKGWNWVDFISNGLLTACMCIWWVFVTQYANSFDTSLRHNVYADLSPTANYLALNQEGEQLTQSWADTDRLRSLIDMLNWYFALNGINILLLIARMLRLMDFQPRLGVVTRSLWLAGPDLIHFAIVAGMVFVGYAMMAHLIFGNAILNFQTFGDSVNTCFEILLGNIDVNNDLRALGGLQSVAGALFFWTYELLVFMVLLNFLLAIIVDAFSEVKEKTHETVGIHTELYQLMRDKWRSLLGSCSSNYISDDKLGSLLKQWAGDEKDDKEKEVQGEVQKLLTILNEDLDEEDLRNVLMECLKDAPNQDGGNDDGASKAAAAPRTGLARFLPQRRKVTASPHEVSQAAKYIVDRFGVPVEAEEELLDGGDDGHTTHEAHAIEGGNAGGGGGGGNGGASGALSPTAMASVDKERDQLANALERLAEVQRELADGQRNLMSGQKQLAEQQAKLVGLMNVDGSNP